MNIKCFISAKWGGYKKSSNCGEKGKEGRGKGGVIRISERLGEAAGIITTRDSGVRKRGEKWGGGESA